MDSVISVLNSYLDLNFEVLEKGDDTRYGNGNDIRLVNLEPIALFSNFKLTSSTGKHLEDIPHTHLIFLVYKLITSSKDSDDLSIRFHRSRDKRRDELAQNKHVKGKYHLRIMLKDVFGFAECQEKGTCGLYYKLTLTRNKDEALIDEAVGIVDARTRIDQIDWYVPHCTSSLDQERILTKQIVNKIPTQLRYIERSLFIKAVNIQKVWNFELGALETMDVPIWITINRLSAKRSTRFSRFE